MIDDSGEMFGAAKLNAIATQTAEAKIRLKNFLFILREASQGH